jgi:hypothetical protein
MADDYGERLARIEEGIKSLGRSVDQLRSNFEQHTAEEKRLEEAVTSIQIEMASVKGGYRTFLKLCAALGIIVGLFIAWESS